MKFFRMIGVMSLLVFSFYLTDFVTDLAINSNTLMQSIKNNKENYCVESVNAIIVDNTIVPGIKGKEINEMQSYLNMRDFGSFNSNYLIYDNLKPDISVEDNKDKVIISGNKMKRQISLLVSGNYVVKKYLLDNNIKFSNLIKYDDEMDCIENINIENDYNLFDDLDTLLNKNNSNKNICILNYSNIKRCNEKEYFIVEPSIKINNSNIVVSLKSINNGSIVLIDNNLSLDNFKLFLNKINNLDLKIVYLSKIIEE